MENRKAFMKLKSSFPIKGFINISNPDIMKSSTLFLHPLKREILHLIENSNGAYYGDIVRQMKRSSSVVIKHIMELKQDGYLKKDQQGGKFISIR